MASYRTLPWFRPGDPNRVPLAQFLRWLDWASPEELEDFGRAWFPRRWASDCPPMTPRPLRFAVTPRGRKPVPPAPQRLS